MDSPLFLIELFAVYGLVGHLIEVWFTGFHSLIVDRNLRAISTTYIWMWFLYGFAGCLFSVLHGLSPLPVWLNAALYVPIIFGLEYGTGWAWLRVVGKRLWEYPASRWTIDGHIRLDYAGWWFLAALFFETTNSAFRTATERFVQAIVS